MANQRPGQAKKTGPVQTQTKPVQPATSAAPGNTRGIGNTVNNLNPAANNPPNQRKLSARQEAMRRRQALRRRNRLIVTGLIVVVGLAVAAIIFAIVSQPAKFEALPATATLDNAIPLDSGLTPVDALETMGSSTAKVTLTEYGDFQCPSCKQFYTSDEKTLIADYIKTGKVKFVFANFPFLDRNLGAQESHVSAEAAYCAADQKRFWDFHGALYDNQLPENSGKLTVDRMKQLAAALALNKDQFNSCLDSHKFRGKVDKDNKAALAKGVNGTPTFFINDQLASGATANARPTYEELKKLLETALAAEK